MSEPVRLTASPLELLRQATGGPRDMATKLSRLLGAVGSYLNAPALDRRLARLRSLGHIERVPTRIQLLVGSVDMLRFWISPAAADYYASRGISYSFHQVLRILDEPSSMVDPTGFLSTRDNIIGHLMQTVHANPTYDLQLLDSHEDGLAELERQVLQMLAGTHERTESIQAIVEEPDYHGRLLDFVRSYRADPHAEAPIRDNVADDPRWRDLETTFGTLPNSMRYFANMPTTLRAAVWHLSTVHTYPRELGVLAN